MMRQFALLSALILASGVFAAAQESREPLPRPGQIDTTRPQARAEDTDAIFGKIKEMEGKNRIVIAVDNAPDKTYNLTDKKKTVRLADGLAVGDRVKVLEHENGENETVDIVRDTRDRGHGERSRKAPPEDR
jgi:hypothetical protein